MKIYNIDWSAKELQTFRKIIRAEVTSLLQIEGAHCSETSVPNCQSVPYFYRKYRT
jgi:hypothetical protein